MLNIIILAAGKGTRMRSNKPKVLHPVAGKPMLFHVIDTATTLNADKIIIVTGHEAELLEATVSQTYDDVAFVRQTTQEGTGHAVKQALPLLNKDADVLVLYGDSPLIRSEHLQPLLNAVSDNSMAMLTAVLDDATGYGRIIRSASDNANIDSVVEQKDADDQQKSIREINTGVFAGKASHFSTWIPLIKNDNSQGEYYLPDLIPLANSNGSAVKAIVTTDSEANLGANDRKQLAELESIYRRKATEKLFSAGANIIDPTRLDIRGNVQVGQDVSFDINVILQGDVTLGDGVQVGAHCTLINCTIGANTVIEPYSLIEGSTVADSCNIGPYARLRPDSVLHSGSKVGNFVEMKKSTLGQGSKANHFTYLGDTTVGKNVNIGAGTITCNYDGANKHQTVIGDSAFIGSNSSLVAPVTIGELATIGAGSTVTGTIEAGGLTLSRSPSKHLPKWQRPAKKQKS